MQTLLVILLLFCCVLLATSIAVAAPPTVDREHEFTLPSDAGRVYRGAITSDEATNSLFVATLRRPAQVYKIAVSPASGKMRLAATTVLNTNEDSSHAVFFDPQTKFLWVGCSTPRGLPGHIAIVNTVTMQRETSLTLFPNETDVYSIVAPTSGDHVYIGLHSRPARIVEATRHHIHRTRGLTLPDSLNRVFAMVIPSDDSTEESAAEYLYATVGGAQPSVVKVDLETFLLVDQLALDRRSGEKDPTTILTDSFFFLYVATFSNPSRVFRISLTDFSRVRAAPGGDEEAVNFGAAATSNDGGGDGDNDGGKARWFYRLAHLDTSTNRLFVLCEDNPSTLVVADSESLKVRTNNGILTLKKDSEAHSGAAAAANGALYVATGTLPPKIVSYRFLSAADAAAAAAAKPKEDL